MKKNKINLVLFLAEKETFLIKNFILNFKKFEKFINFKLIICSKKTAKLMKKKSSLKMITNDKRNTHQILKNLNKMNLEKKNLYGLSLQFPWIIKERVLNKFNFIMNCHFGRIPEYKGHNTISHAILNNEKNIWGSIHKMKKKVDAAVIIKEIKVKHNLLNVREIEKKLSLLFLKSLLIIFKNIFNKKKITTLQRRNVKEKFYRKNQIFKEKEITKFSEIPLKLKACNIDNYEPAYIKVKGKKYYLFENDNWD